MALGLPSYKSDMSAVFMIVDPYPGSYISNLKLKPWSRPQRASHLKKYSLTT